MYFFLLQWCIVHGVHLVLWCACTFLGLAEGSLLGEAALSLEPLTSRAKESSRPDIACIKHMC